jgi:catechol 2,3-dioxygenase-like lactoylglutathione lyase family enzyme
LTGRLIVSPPSVLGDGPVQLAYLVDDVERAAAQWAERGGAGPFFVRHHIPVSEVEVDGEPAVFDHSSAYGWWGSMMVELVAVHEPASLARPGPLHHVAYFVESFERATAALAGSGWPAVLTATGGQTRFAFHDATAELGHLVEIYEGSPRLRSFYDMVREASQGWDGITPIRRLD